MGNRLSKIYTRTGDDGSTAMADGRRLNKSDLLFEVMGDIDELNAHIGMIRALLPKPSAKSVPKKPPIATDPASCKISHYQQQLSIIQHLLFNVGGELAMPEYRGVKLQHIKWLEANIDAMNVILPPLKDFILPAGEQLTCQIHITRTVCRRAERHAVQLNNNKPNALSTTTYQFINRLSDWLFVFARLSTHPSFLLDRYAAKQITSVDQSGNSTTYTANHEVLWDKRILANFDQTL